MGMWNGIELDDLTLTGEGLVLRPVRLTDAEAVYAAMQDRLSFRFVPRIAYPYTAADAHAFITGPARRDRATGSGFTAAITRPGSDRILGTISLRLPTGPDVRGEVGYGVYPEARGGGLAATATRAVAQWAFAHGLVGLSLRCHVENLASARTALRAGFSYEGTQRAGLPDGDRYADAALFARLAGDSGEPVAARLPALPADGLGDGVVRVRAVCPDDADAIYDELTDPLSVQWGFGGPALTPDQARRRAVLAGLDWLVGSTATMAICVAEPDGSAVAGGIAIRQVGPPGVGGIGYGLRPAYRGRGLTARALRLVRDWALSAGGLHRLELGAKRANVASQKVAAAAGFRADGVRAERLRNADGSYSDEVRFAFLAGDRP